MKRRRISFVGKIVIGVTVLIFAGIFVFCFLNMTSHKGKYRQEGLKAFEAGEYETAISLFQDALDEDQWFTKKMDIDIYMYKADAECHLGKYKTACDTYHQVEPMLSDKDLTKVYHLEMQADAMQSYIDEDYESAIDKFKGLVDGGDDWYLEYIGSCYGNLGQIEEMTDAFEAHIVAHGGDAFIYSQYAAVALNNEDYENAIIYIERGKAYPEEKEYRDILLQEIDYYENIKDFNTAFDKAKEFISLYPEDSAGKKEYDFLESRVVGE